MKPLDLVNLSELMERTVGNPDMRIGLIDGPVAIDHPDLAGGNIRSISGVLNGACTVANSYACHRGILVVGIRSGKRDSNAPAVCPDCTLRLNCILNHLPLQS